MLYLIGGASRSGKSLVAQKLLKEKGIPYLPLDSIVMGFTRGIPEHGVHDKLFPDDIAKRLWPFVKAMCEDLIFVGKDYAVEGEALLPADINDLIARHPNKITACFLGYAEISQEQKLKEIKRFNENSADWLIKEADTYITDHISNMIQFSQYLKEQCRVCKMSYFDVSDNFMSGIQAATDHLSEI